MTLSNRHDHTNLNLSRRSFLMTGGLAALGLAGCSSSTGSTSASTSSSQASSSATAGTNSGDLSTIAIDDAAWSYDSDNDVYYQIGVQYCTTPAATDYESMGIYVPGSYFTGTANGDGTYTCKVNESGTVGSFTASSAPVVIPVNTAGYAAQPAPTSYSADGLTSYLSAGLVYVYPGCRGRNNGENSDGTSFAGGAPWGVTDLKAAVRCLRYSSSAIPGGAKKVFTFGHSGGGAQSSLMGATGDSELYYPYLESIGAAMTDDGGSAISDSVTGSMCWCPITALDEADEAYEWMMGQFATSGTRADGTWTKVFSGDLAESFATWINEVGLVDAQGNVLALGEGGEGAYTSGTYYDQVVSVIEGSLNNFLTDTTFPYTPSSTTMADGGFGGGSSSGMTGGRMSGGTMPTDASSSGAPSGSAPTDASDSGAPSGGMPSGGMSSSGSSTDSTTYNTVEDYIASLNSDTEWVSYDSSTNTATITSMGAFVTHCKSASKDVGAFDSLERSQAENYLFGNSESDALHFDATMSKLLTDNQDSYAACSDFDSSYVDAYKGDMSNTDDLGTLTADRQKMYNPMYFVCAGYEGFGSATPAAHWRIRTGIDQGDTSLTTEMNLALALEANSNVQDVDFETVWGLGHTTAERTGDAATNFISWVEGCCA